MQRRKLPLTLISLFSVTCLTACPESDDGGDDSIGDTAGDTTTDVGTTGTDTDGTGTDAGTTDAGTTDAGTTDAGTTDTTTTDTTDTTDTTGGDACGNDPGWGALAVGEPVKHIMGVDQAGAEFNLCEHYGKPVALDVAAVWCGPCNDVSNFFANGGADPFGGGLGDQLKALIDDGSILWATMLIEDGNGQPTTVANATAWDAQYPNANIPVVVEGDTPMIPQYVQLQCWPSVFVTDAELKWLALDDCMTWNHLFTLVNMF